MPLLQTLSRRISFPFLETFIALRNLTKSRVGTQIHLAKLKVVFHHALIIYLHSLAVSTIQRLATAPFRMLKESPYPPKRKQSN